VPMVLWVPGEKPRTIEKMTSHLDMPVTIMQQLGVTNPPQDHSMGFDMLGSDQREYTVVSDWYFMGCVDHQYKCVFPVEKSRGRQEVTTKGDKAVEETETYYQTRRPMLLEIGDQMREFAR
jgi:uncharacterized protein